MCKNIAAKAGLSEPIQIYDISEQQTQKVKAQLGDSAIVASSITSAAADADVIFFSVSDDKAVLAVLDQVLANDISGKLIVDCSTIHPDTTRQEARMIKERGGEFAACPMFGAAAMADAGQLICVLAGEATITEKVKPFCYAIGKQIIDLSGEDPGKSTLLKLIGNTFVLNMLVYSCYNQSADRTLTWCLLLQGRGSRRRSCSRGKVRPRNSTAAQIHRDNVPRSI